MTLTELRAYVKGSYKWTKTNGGGCWLADKAAVAKLVAAEKGWEK